MRIAFCTICKGRLEHLRKTLSANIRENADYDDCVFVVLAYDDPSVLEYAKAAHPKDIASGRLVVYTYNSGMPFHLSHGKNLAARCGMREGAQVLVTQDADNYTGSGFAKFIAEKFHKPGIRPGIFLCPNYQLIKSLPHGALRPARGYAGRLAIWTQTFLKLGGYCESFDTWRGEDIDMVFRLERMGYSRRYIPNEYLHALNHSSEVRFREYPNAQQYENGNQVDIIKARTDTVVNYGRFGLGTVRRNFSEQPIELAPVPTRILGIGLQKTATTSLHKALQILGFDSLHWGTGEAPLIWHEMNALGRSPTLEQWYALSDTPIPLLFRELDAAYPGSRFILTIRDEIDWLRSVRRLWSYEHNPTRRLWDVYPFTNQIHTALYGQKDFDALVFLERYRRHNAEVRAYFKSRPADLLVMNMDAGGSWRALCGFLGCAVPDVPYPRANRTGAIAAVTT
jgi:hypothetical protein